MDKMLFQIEARIGKLVFLRSVNLQSFCLGMQTMCLKCIRVLFQVQRLKAIYSITPFRLVSFLIYALSLFTIFAVNNFHSLAKLPMHVAKCCRVSKWVCGIKRRNEWRRGLLSTRKQKRKEY